MKKMKILVAFALLAFAITSSIPSTSSVPEPALEISAKPCNCPDVIDDVCANGVRYKNTCYALCAGVDPMDITRCIDP